jgi:hypothetical protein
MRDKTPTKDPSTERPSGRDPALERAIEATACELQMGQYPIFCITTAKPGDTRMTYREKLLIGSQEVLKEWCIQVTSHYGWPGEHEAEVWRSIQHIAELRGRARTLSNPIQTTLEEIREHMSSKSKGGRQWSAIIHSLKCLANTKLESTHWYDTSQKNYDMADFSVISDLKLSERELPDGRKVINKVYIGFGPVLFENIRKRYVRPLDKGYMDTQLDRWLSKRLYELLAIKFYGLRKKGVPYRTRYSRLCGMLGTKRQQYLSRAKLILHPAHRELQRTGFLAQIEWFPLLSVEQDWMLRYWPGPRAKAGWKKAYWKLVPELQEPLYVEEPQMGPEPLCVEEPPAELDEEAITAEVLTEPAPEMPLQLPLMLEEPLEVQGTEVTPGPEPKSPAKASRKPQEPLTRVEASETPRKARKAPSEPLRAPAMDDGTGSYAKEALSAFERGTGKHRRLARVTAAEERCLLQWRAAGATAADIEEGTRRALAEQRSKGSAEGGRRAQEIVSLAYVRGAVLDAAKRRQELEAQRREALRKVRASQSAELREEEASLKKQLQGRLRPGLYQGLFEELVLAAKEEDHAIVLAPERETLAVYTAWKELLEELLGRSPIFGSVAEWAARLR